MNVEQAIIEILKSVGIYERARRIIGSDVELAKLFDEDFEQLISKIGE